MQCLVHATREASWAMVSSSHIWKKSFFYSLTILYMYSEYLDDIYSQHVPSTVLLISNRSLPTFMSFVCNSLHPVTAVWWNVDWYCWLGLVQIYYFYFCVTMTAVSSGRQQPYHVQKTAFPSISPLPLALASSAFSSALFPELWRGYYRSPM